MLIILALCEVMVERYPNSYRYKTEWMNKHAEEVETLVLGGSHTYYAVRPDQLGKNAFSLANVSQGPEYDYYLLSKWANKYKRLKTVIMVADETNLFDPPMETEELEWYRCIYYKLYTANPKHSWFSKYNFELSSIHTFSRKLPHAFMYMLTGKYNLECDSSGFGTSFITPEVFNKKMMETTSKIALERHRCKDYSAIAENKMYADKIVDFCKKRNIRIILITPPMWKGFYEGINKRQLNTMYSLIDDEVKNHGALYKDYLRDDRFQGTDFYDGDHLSAQGATKFTQILKKDFGGF